MLHFSNLKIIGIGLIVFLGFLFSSPNFMDERVRLSLPGFLPGGQLNLGLDLQGGEFLCQEGPRADGPTHREASLSGAGGDASLCRGWLPV